MIVQRSDRERLILAHFPWLFALIDLLIVGLCVWFLVKTLVDGQEQPDFYAKLVGIPFILIFAAIFSYFGEITRFDFDLVRRELTWSRRNLFRKRGGVIPFDQIQYAVVGTSGNCCRPELLVTHLGSIPLLGYHTSDEPNGNYSRRIAAIVNAALIVSSNSDREKEILERVLHGDWPTALELAQKRYGFDAAAGKTFEKELKKRIAFLKSGGAKT
jgi:hypothetical protein